MNVAAGQSGSNRGRRHDAFQFLPRAAGYKNKMTAILIACEALNDGRHRTLVY
jgi:hypothetical protein